MQGIVRLPFAYEADIWPPRKRGFTTVAVKGFVDVSLERSPGADAPVAFRIREGGGDSVPYRAFGGRLFRPVLAEDGRGVAPAEFSGIACLPGVEIRMRSPERRWWPMPDLPLPSGISPVGLPTLDEAVADYGPREAVRIAGDDGERRMARAVACFLDALLVVDGEIWTAEGCAEPHWSVEFDAAVPGLDVRLRRAEVPGAAAFSLLRLDDAAAYAREVADAHLGPGSRVGVEAAGVDVLLPSALRRDDLVALGVQVRSAVLGERGIRTWEHEPGAMPGAVRSTADDLVASAEAAGPDPSREESLAVLHALLAFHDACAGGGDLPDAIEGGRLLTRGAARRFRFELRCGFARGLSDPGDEEAFGRLGI